MFGNGLQTGTKLPIIYGAIPVTRKGQIGENIGLCGEDRGYAMQTICVVQNAITILKLIEAVLSASAVCINFLRPKLFQPSEQMH